MNIESKLSLLEFVNKITTLNYEFLSKISEVSKGTENLSEDQEKKFG